MLDDHDALLYSGKTLVFTTDAIVLIPDHPRMQLHLNHLGTSTRSFDTITTRIQSLHTAYRARYVSFCHPLLGLALAGTPHFSTAIAMTT